MVHYKPGKYNILADAMSRRPDYDRRIDLGHRAEGVGDDDDFATCVAEGVHATVTSSLLALHQHIKVNFTTKHEILVLALVSLWSLASGFHTLSNLSLLDLNWIGKYW